MATRGGSRRRRTSAPIRSATSSSRLNSSSERDDYPRPMNGIFVAITVRNCTLASSGRLAMNSTASTTWARSSRGSGGVRPRRVRGEGSVVDDASAHRTLILHQQEGLLGAQERARQVHVHDRLPLRGRQLLEPDAGRAGAGVVEQQIQAPEGRARGREQASHRSGIADIRRGYEPARRVLARFPQRRLEQMRAPPREHDRVAAPEQRDRDTPAYSRTSSGDEGNLEWIGHVRNGNMPRT